MNGPPWMKGQLLWTPYGMSLDIDVSPTPPTPPKKTKTKQTNQTNKQNKAKKKNHLILIRL